MKIGINRTTYSKRIVLSDSKGMYVLDNPKYKYLGNNPKAINEVKNTLRTWHENVINRQTFCH
jgi:hypothetical protein